MWTAGDNLLGSTPMPGSDLGLSYDDPAYSGDEVINEQNVRLIVTDVYPNAASPTPLPEGQETPTPTVVETGSGFSLNTPVLRDAFCTGGLITAMLFLLWGLYVLAKASIRWYMRDTTRPPSD